MSDIIFTAFFDLFQNLALSEPFVIVIFSAVICICFGSFLCFLKFKR